MVAGERGIVGLAMVGSSFATRRTIDGCTVWASAS